MEMVDLPRLMELLGYDDYAHRLEFSYQGKQTPDGSYIVDTDSIKGFWLKDTCDIDKSGIKAKPLEDYFFNLLSDSEQKVRSDFEKDIQLDLPCTLDEVKAWVQRNDFGDLLDESELLKERQKSIVEIKARREPGTVTVDDLLKTPIATLLEEIRPEDGFDRYFQLFTWKDLLKKAEILRVNKAPYTDEARREDRLAIIHDKINEIDGHLRDCTATPPALEYGEPELSCIDAIEIYPALKLLGDDWTAEEFALQVFYGGIRAFKKNSNETEKLNPVTNIQDWLKNHGKAEIFSGEFYSIKKALLKFNYSKSELSKFIPEYRYISYQQAIIQISELIGNIEDAEEYLIDKIEQHKILAFHPFIGTVTPKQSLDGERWRSGYFAEWKLKRLLTDKFGEIETSKGITENVRIALLEAEDKALDEKMTANHEQLLLTHKESKELDPRYRFFDKFGKKLTLLELIQRWGNNEDFVNESAFAKKIRPSLDGREAFVCELNNQRTFLFTSIEDYDSKQPCIVEDVEDCPQYTKLPDDTYFYWTDILNFEEANPEIKTRLSELEEKRAKDERKVMGGDGAGSQGDTEPASTKVIQAVVEVIAPKQSNKVTAVFSEFQNLRANEISLVMMENGTAKMVIRGKSIKVNPDELGLEADSQHWKWLGIAAVNQGSLASVLKRFNSRSDLEAEKGRIKTAVSRLRKTLKDAMGLEDDPIKYMKGNGYKFTFKMMTHELLKDSNVSKGDDAMDYVTDDGFDDNQPTW
jgi:hypothetical protein